MKANIETSLLHLWNFCQSTFGANATIRFAQYVGDLIDKGEITKEDSTEFSKMYLAKMPVKKTNTRAKMVHEPFYDNCAGTMVKWDEEKEMYIADPELESARKKRLAKEKLKTKRDKALKNAIDKTPRYRPTTDWCGAPRSIGCYTPPAPSHRSSGCGYSPRGC